MLKDKAALADVLEEIAAAAIAASLAETDTQRTSTWVRLRGLMTGMPTAARDHLDARIEAIGKECS